MNTKFGLPEKVIFCSKCVISNQRPSSTIEFASDINSKKRGIQLIDGVCEACRYGISKNNEIDWEEREAKLFLLAEKIRSEKGKSGYDIVVPGSGGKDSAFTAHILKNKFGLNPLTVTWAPHLYTEIGWKNFINWSHVGGLDNILFTPNGLLHRKLTREAFINLLHPFQPFILGQRIIGPRIAQKYGIKYVFYGENQAEYGNSINENDFPTMKQEFFVDENLRAIKLGGRIISDLIRDNGFKLEEFSPYLPLSLEEGKDIEVHYLGFYLKWDPQECFYYAFENTGFKPNTERTEGSYSKYSSIDDKIDPFHYYTTLIKFGLGRASYDAAQEIRNGKITREEGISLVHKYDLEFPTKYYQEFLDYVSLNDQQFSQIVDSFRPEHLWSNRDSKWTLKFMVK